MWLAMGEAKRKAAVKAMHPWPGSHGRCPVCRGLRVLTMPAPDTDFYARELTICADCSAVWEPLDEAQIWDRTDPYCSFKEPCNNCAFRPGSPESENKEKWRALLESLKAGAQFDCHKGVPIDPTSEDGFLYPKKEGEPDRARLRLCRGYLNALGTWWKIDRGENTGAEV